MAAGIGIQRRSGGLPGRVPDSTAFIDIEVMAVAVIRNIVVAVAGQAEKLCILIKTVAAAGIGDQGKEVFTAQVVDPWKRSCLLYTSDAADE